MKTYKTHLELSLLVGGNTITFRDERGGHFFRTNDERTAAIIESHPLFADGTIVLHSDEVVLPPRQNAPCKNTLIKHAEQENMEIVDAVRTCADARMYLQQKLGDDAPYLKSKADIVRAAKEINVFFPNL